MALTMFSVDKACPLGTEPLVARRFRRGKTAVRKRRAGWSELAGGVLESRLARAEQNQCMPPTPQEPEGTVYLTSRNMALCLIFLVVTRGTAAKNIWPKKLFSRSLHEEAC